MRIQQQQFIVPGIHNRNIRKFQFVYFPKKRGNIFIHRIVINIGRQSFIYDLTVKQHKGFVCKRQSIRTVVCGNNTGHSFGFQVGKKITAQCIFPEIVNMAEWFIQQQYFRFQCKHSCQRDTLLLSAAQKFCFYIRIFCHFYNLQQFLNALFFLFRVKIR